MNYIPYIHEVAKEHGSTACAVLGAVWRHCLYNDGECDASQEEIASELKLCSRSVRSHLKTLVNAGFFDAEFRPGKTTVYQDTGKAALDLERGQK